MRMERWVVNEHRSVFGKNPGQNMETEVWGREEWR